MMSSPEHTTLGFVEPAAVTVARSVCASVASGSVAAIATLPAPEEDQAGRAQHHTPDAGGDPARQLEVVLGHQRLSRDGHADRERLEEQDRADQPVTRVVRDAEE